MEAIRVLLIFGTRPEAIKLAPVVLRLLADPGFQPRVCVTAQHRGMLDQVLDLFGLRPDVDLDIMRDGEGLFEVTARGLLALERVIAEAKPDLVLVQGDTTTTFIGSLASYYCRVPVAHVEAGLRTDDKYRPFPEEVNRRLTSAVADLHFAPTGRARENLLREGIPESRIFVTGNTTIDALRLMKARIEGDAGLRAALADRFPWARGPRRLLLVTAHRRESFGPGFESICSALRAIAARNPDVLLFYPVHPNPNVRAPVTRSLHGVENIALAEPLAYDEFVFLMLHAYLVLTDSGGIQEEAPFLGKPVLVMREVTERPEAIEAGALKLVGTREDRIVAGVEELLHDAESYRRMAVAGSPYGDGTASEKIVAAIAASLRARGGPIGQ